MGIADEIYSAPNSIDTIVRGGLKKPSHVPSMDYQAGMVANPDLPTVPNSIGSSRVYEKPLTPFQEGASAIGAGLRAGDAGANTPTYDQTDAFVKVGSSTVAGAVAGGAVGGPMGAAFGGAAGALEGGLNAWLSLRASKRQRSQMNAIRQETRERQAKEDALTAEEKAYNRSQASKAGAADLYFKTVGQLERLAANDANLKQLFVQRGY